MSAWVGLEVIKLPSVFHLYQAPQCDVSTNHNGELSIVFILYLTFLLYFICLGVFCLRMLILMRSFGRAIIRNIVLNVALTVNRPHSKILKT